MRAALVASLALGFVAVSARPMRRASFTLQNGQDAIALNDKFKTLTADSACDAGEDACVQGKFAQCVSGKFVIQACAPGTICAALPLDNSPGTSITCTTQSDLDARIAATGATDASAGSSSASSSAAAASASASSTSTGTNNAGSGSAAGSNSGDLQSSLTLDSSVLAKGFENDGQDVPASGQVASLTSSNNFINFCALTLPATPLTNGQQVKTGSCNPAPMGLIPSTANMPSSKFINPVNMQQINENETFNVVMGIQGMETGHFVNADENYFSAPQQLNAQGQIQGHSHIVVEAIDSFTSTKISNPSVFAFFKGLNSAATNGQLTATVDKGLPAGFYKVSSINTAANHQPVLVPIAQHGSLDDAVYFQVVAAGSANATKSA